MLSHRTRFAGRRPVGGLALAGLVSITLTAGHAQAEEGKRGLAPGDWSAVLGVGGFVSPEYPGGKDLSVSPVPLVDLRYRVGSPVLDTVFLNTQDGFGVVALRRGAFSAGASVNYAGGRDQDETDRLNGLGDIDGAVVGTMFLRADFGAVELSLEANRAFGEQEGTTIALGGSYEARLTSALTVTGHVGVTWADETSMQEWFGVNAWQASRSRYAVYEPEAGFRSAEIGVSAVYALSNRWSINAKVGVSRLLGDAADSPIVEEKTQPSAFLGVTYRF